MLFHAQVQVPPGLVDDARETLSQRFPGRAAEDLVQQVAVGQGVLGNPDTGSVDRDGVGEQVHECFTVVERDVERLQGERREAGLVREQVAHRRRVLAGASELGPDGGDLLVEGDRALADRVQAINPRVDVLADLFAADVEPVAQEYEPLTDDRAPVEWLTDRMIIEHIAQGGELDEDFLPTKP